MKSFNFDLSRVNTTWSTSTGPTLLHTSVSSNKLDDREVILVGEVARVLSPDVVVGVAVTGHGDVHARVGHAALTLAAAGGGAAEVVGDLARPVAPAGRDDVLALAVRVVDERRLALPADELLARPRLVDDGDGFLQRHVVRDLQLELARPLVPDHLFLLLLIMSCKKRVLLKQFFYCYFN